jgi:flavin-dependent dehydrogenase
LGIALRQRGVPVTVWEAGRYPRHRVCGEFISGLGLEALARLELLALLERAGARRAESVAFFLGEGESLRRALPQPALCISRFALEHALAAELRRLGGQLREGARWREGFWAEGVVRASGRRASTAGRGRGWRWFGLKAHALGVELASDLEMHVGAKGYVGLCRVETGAVNVCGLFRRRAGEPTGSVVDWLRGGASGVLAERLARAEFVRDSFCAVAGLNWSNALAPGVGRRGEPSAAYGCCVGDALAAIAPVTGNGMSMAFESAALASAPLADWSAGRWSWAEAQREVLRVLHGRFAARLRWGRWLQRALFAGQGARQLLLGLSRSDRVWRWFFWRTRV